MQKHLYMNSDICWGLYSEFLCTYSLPRILGFSVFCEHALSEEISALMGRLQSLWWQSWSGHSSNLLQLPGEVMPISTHFCLSVTWWCLCLQRRRCSETQISIMQRHCSPSHSTFVTLTVLSLKYKKTSGFKVKFLFLFSLLQMFKSEILIYL